MQIFNIRERFLSHVRGDVFGGVTAGIVALPLALGFGVASGMENGAAAGLYGAICVGLFASLFGGTPTQISGPTGPMTVVVAGMVGAMTGDPRYIFAAVILAGIFQIVLGVLRIGRYINYIPYPVVSGFMSGIGIIIIILQAAQMVGHRPAAGTVEAIRRLPEDFTDVNFAALALGLGSIAVIYATPRFTKVVPGALVALFTMTVVSVLVPMEVPRIGAIPQGLPQIDLPPISMEMLTIIFMPALLLGAIASIDSLLTSLVADSLTKSRHDSEQELFGQGIGNVVAGLIGGLPGAGATMRTVVNIKSGGRSHLSGVIHSLLLIATLFLIAPVAETIPMAVLAGILITVGIGILDLKGLSHLLKVPRGDAAVMLTVFGLTVFVDLMWAVGVGMVMAAMILLKRMSDMDPATHSPLVDIAAHRWWIPALEAPEEILEDVYVVEVHGSLFFGNAGPLQRKLAAVKDAESVVLHMGDVRYMDQSGVYALADLIQDLQSQDTEVFVAELHEEPHDILLALNVIPDTIAKDRVYEKASDAISAATSLHLRKAS